MSFIFIDNIAPPGVRIHHFRTPIVDISALPRPAIHAELRRLLTAPRLGSFWVHTWPNDDVYLGKDGGQKMSEPELKALAIYQMLLWYSFPNSKQGDWLLDYMSWIKVREWRVTGRIEIYPDLRSRNEALRARVGG